MFEDVCDFDVVFFGHVVMMIDFVVGVKRLFVGKDDRLGSLAASDALNACRAEEQGAEFFREKNRLAD